MSPEMTLAAIVAIVLVLILLHLMEYGTDRTPRSRHVDTHRIDMSFLPEEREIDD